MWRSVRARATLGATVVTAVALVGGAIVFGTALTSAVRDASVRTAEHRADELADRLDDEASGFVSELDDVVQIIDADGRVVRASSDAEDFAGPFPEGVEVRIDGEPHIAASEDLDGDQRLVVAVSVEDDAEVIAAVTTLLIVAVPLLVAFVGLITWIVLGRALRPVDRIRREVDSVTAARLHRRIPVPETGDEIAALAVTMNGMLDRLDAAAAAQRRFVSDASHELRSPLATIRQHAELAASHPEATSLDEFAALARDEGLRLQALVEGLLVLARLDEGAPARADAVDLDDLALASAARVRAAGVVVDGSGIGAARVHGDPLLWDRVVRNLVDNAVRHRRERVTIAAATIGAEGVLTVSDDGSGIPAAERERVFERFVRLDEGRSRDAGGSGLGLAIVRAVVEAAGGSVEVAEAPGQGARFTVRAPSAP